MAKFLKHVKRNPLPIPNAVMVRVMGVAVEKFTVLGSDIDQSCVGKTHRKT